MVLLADVFPQCQVNYMIISANLKNFYLLELIVVENSTLVNPQSFALIIAVNRIGEDNHTSSKALVTGCQTQGVQISPIWPILMSTFVLSRKKAVKFPPLSW